MLHKQKSKPTMMLSEMIRLLQDQLEDSGDVPIFIQHQPTNGQSWGTVVDIEHLYSCIIEDVECVTITPDDGCACDFTQRVRGIKNK